MTTPFRDWLARVLADGESVQAAAPVLDRAAVAADLRAAFARHALDVAGPSVPFDPDAAAGAALALARACWWLVSGEDAELAVGVPPTAPAAHLSADVCLRFLPAVRRRALARSAAGEPLAALDRLLRAWPLSGVLADLDGGPFTVPDFAGHAGLQLLYAERLADAPRAGWVPPPGPARERAEAAFAARGRSLPAPPPEVPARDG